MAFMGGDNYQVPITAPFPEGNYKASAQNSALELGLTCQSLLLSSKIHWQPSPLGKSFYKVRLSQFLQKF